MTDNLRNHFLVQLAHILANGYSEIFFSPRKYFASVPEYPVWKIFLIIMAYGCVFSGLDLVPLVVNSDIHSYFLICPYHLILGNTIKVITVKNFFVHIKS